jgi:[ribosomal protein S5]-alanine N-acetyltransferase
MRPLQDLFSVFPLIESERLILRQVMPEDAADFLACQSDPDVFRYSGRSELTSLEAARDWLNILFKRHQEQTLLSWAIVLKEDQHFIGRFQLEDVSAENRRTGVGYLLGKQYWGNGYATEALCAVIAYLFEQTTVNRIDTFAWAENIASTRVMEKAGMHFEGLARQKRCAKGAFHDFKYYAILREDFFNGKGHPSR